MVSTRRSAKLQAESIEDRAGNAAAPPTTRASGRSKAATKNIVEKNVKKSTRSRRVATPGEEGENAKIPEANKVSAVRRHTKLKATPASTIALLASPPKAKAARNRVNREPVVTGARKGKSIKVAAPMSEGVIDIDEAAATPGPAVRRSTRRKRAASEDPVDHITETLAAKRQKRGESQNDPTVTDHEVANDKTEPASPPKRSSRTKAVKKRAIKEPVRRSTRAKKAEEIVLEVEAEEEATQPDEVVGETSMVNPQSTVKIVKKGASKKVKGKEVVSGPASEVSEATQLDDFHMEEVTQSGEIHNEQLGGPRVTKLVGDSGIFDVESVLDTKEKPDMVFEQKNNPEIGEGGSVVIKDDTKKEKKTKRSKGKEREVMEVVVEEEEGASEAQNEVEESVMESQVEGRANVIADVESEKKTAAEQSEVAIEHTTETEPQQAAVVNTRRVKPRKKSAATKKKGRAAAAAARKAKAQLQPEVDAGGDVGIDVSKNAGVGYIKSVASSSRTIDPAVVLGSKRSGVKKTAPKKNPVVKGVSRRGRSAAITGPEVAEVEAVAGGDEPKTEQAGPSTITKEKLAEKELEAAEQDVEIEQEAGTEIVEEEVALPMFRPSIILSPTRIPSPDPNLDPIKSSVPSSPITRSASQQLHSSPLLASPNPTATPRASPTKKLATHSTSGRLSQSGTPSGKNLEDSRDIGEPSSTPTRALNASIHNSPVMMMPPPTLNVVAGEGRSPIKQTPTTESVLAETPSPAGRLSFVGDLSSPVVRKLEDEIPLLTSPTASSPSKTSPIKQTKLDFLQDTKTSTLGSSQDSEDGGDVGDDTFADRCSSKGVEDLVGGFDEGAGEEAEKEDIAEGDLTFTAPDNLSNEDTPSSPLDESPLRLQEFIYEPTASIFPPRADKGDEEKQSEKDEESVTFSPIILNNTFDQSAANWKEDDGAGEEDETDWEQEEEEGKGISFHLDPESTGGRLQAFRASSPPNFWRAQEAKAAAPASPTTGDPEDETDFERSYARGLNEQEDDSFEQSFARGLEMERLGSEQKYEDINLMPDEEIGDSTQFEMSFLRGLEEEREEIRKEREAEERREKMARGRKRFLEAEESPRAIKMRGNSGRRYTYNPGERRAGEGGEPRRRLSGGAPPSRQYYLERSRPEDVQINWTEHIKRVAEERAAAVKIQRAYRAYRVAAKSTETPAIAKGSALHQAPIRPSMASGKRKAEDAVETGRVGKSNIPLARGIPAMSKAIIGEKIVGRNTSQNGLYSVGIKFQLIRKDCPRPTEAALEAVTRKAVGEARERHEALMEQTGCWLHPGEEEEWVAPESEGEGVRVQWDSQLAYVCGEDIEASAGGSKAPTRGVLKAPPPLTSQGNWVPLVGAPPLELPREVVEVSRVVYLGEEDPKDLGGK